MDDILRFDADSQRVLEAARAVSRDVLAKHAAAVDAEARFPNEAIGALAEAGLLGLTVSAEAGGSGQGPGAFAAVVEELAQGCASAAMVYVMHTAATQAIAASQVVAGRDQLLREIAAGRHLTTLAFSERGSRSQFWAPISKLAPAGAGKGLATTADESWVTSARRADSYVSSARAPGAGSPAESTLYLVRTRASGVKVAGPFNGLGLRGNDSAPVRLEGYVVPEGDLLTAQGQGAKAMLEVVLPWFCVGTAAMANGICRGVVAATAKHLGEGAFEHTGERLRDLAVLRARLATMSVRTEASRALLARTVASLEHPTARTPPDVLEARLGALETVVEVTDLGMQAGGGAAFSHHLPLERSFRDARAGWVMAPTVDHLRDFIGRALTGMPLL